MEPGSPPKRALIKRLRLPSLAVSDELKYQTRTAGEPPFTARFDYVYATEQSLRVHGVRPALDADKMEALLSGSMQEQPHSR